MCGFGTDNASVMTGVNNGVYRKLKNDIPNFILIRCVCHSIQLAVSAAVAESLPRNLEFLASETYNWFSRSSERQEQFRILFKALNDDVEPLKIVQLSATRWLSIAGAVSRILKQWLELQTHFRLRSEDKCYTADLLFQMFSDVKNELYFIFLEPILNDTDNVNKAFQAKNADPAKLLDDLTLLIQGLVKLIVVTGCTENFLTMYVANHFHPRPHLGYSFEEKMKEARTKKLLKEDEETTIRTRCIDFVVKLIGQLQQRLPENVGVLRSVSLLSPKNCLRAVKESIVPLARLMGESEESLRKIAAQWDKISLIPWQNTNDTISMWKEVNEYRDSVGRNPFQELSGLALKCLVLPWSNGEVERAFSQMNLVKTTIRNRMTPDTVNSILTIRAGLRRMNKCHSYEFPTAVLRQIGSNAAYVSRAGGSTSSSTSTADNEENEQNNNDEELGILT